MVARLPRQTSMPKTGPGLEAGILAHHNPGPLHWGRTHRPETRTLEISRVSQAVSGRGTSMYGTSVDASPAHKCRYRPRMRHALLRQPTISHPKVSVLRSHPSPPLSLHACPVRPSMPVAAWAGIAHFGPRAPRIILLSSLLLFLRFCTSPSIENLHLDITRPRQRRSMLSLPPHRHPSQRSTLAYRSLSFG